MKNWISIVKERTLGRTSAVSAVFGFSEERPTLTTRTGHTFQRIRDALLGLTDSERALVLLNVCSLEAALQAQTGVMIDRIETEKREGTKKSEPTAPDSELPPERQPGHPAYFLDTTQDGFVLLQWIVDRTTIALKMTADGATRLGADLKGFGEYVLNFQEREPS